MNEIEPQRRRPTLEEALSLYLSGRIADAEQMYRALLAANPSDFRVKYNLGLLLLRSDRAAEAVDYLGAAAQADQGRAANWLSYAEALTASHRTDDALQLIAVLRQRGLSGERLDNLEQAARQDLSSFEAMLREADKLHAAGRAKEALARYQRAAEQRPSCAAAHRGAGSVLYGLGDFEAALTSYERALALEPDSQVTFFNRGNTLRVLKRFEEAIASYDVAIALDPQMAMAHHNRALCLLHLGQLEAGFRAYEWRRRCPTFDDPRYALDRAWTGEEDLAGKTLFIFPELFQGDLIQFSRYARTAERRGARVLLAAPENMHALLQTLSPGIQLLPEAAVPPEFDLQSPLMSLPMAFGTTLETLPGEVRYLRADAARVVRWRERIGPAGFRIGIVWQGSTLPYAIPLQRSYPLAALEPISRLPNVRLISLQKHNGLDQLSRLPTGMTVETLGDQFDPGPDAFVDTAAAMMCCDLVIAMDTSVAHLAGALGVRAWLALPFVADWRWLVDRSDSPWYPSLRLFRQGARGEWDGVFADMESALRSELAAP